MAWHALAIPASRWQRDEYSLILNTSGSERILSVDQPPIESAQREARLSTRLHINGVPTPCSQETFSKMVNFTSHRNGVDRRIDQCAPTTIRHHSLELMRCIATLRPPPALAGGSHGESHMKAITTLDLASKATKGDQFNSVQLDPAGVKILRDDLRYCSAQRPLGDNVEVICIN